MAETGSLQPLQIQPRRDVLQPGDRGPRALFALRAQQPVIMSQYPGGPSAISLVTVPMLAQQILVNVQKPGPRVRVLNLSPPLIPVAGLVHTRALGAPAVSPTIPLSGFGLVHTRGIGPAVVTVSTPGGGPPGGGGTTPPTGATLSGGPRSIKGVRRRDTRSRR